MALDLCTECNSIESFELDKTNELTCKACGADESAKRGLPEEDPTEDR